MKISSKTNRILLRRKAIISKSLNSSQQANKINLHKKCLIFFRKLISIYKNKLIRGNKLKENNSISKEEGIMFMRKIEEDINLPQPL